MQSFITYTATSTTIVSQYAGVVQSENINAAIEYIYSGLIDRGFTGVRKTKDGVLFTAHWPSHMNPVFAFLFPTKEDASMFSADESAITGVIYVSLVSLQEELIWG